MSEHSKNVIEWQKRNPDKAKAHQAVGYAIKTGKLIKGVCEVCGETKVDGHHDDYSKPLEVRWLCRAHHVELHRGKRKYREPREIRQHKPAPQVIELEQLATNLETKITSEWYTRTERIYPQLLDALTTAYALGKSHATSPARKAASRANGAKAKASNTVFRGGRKKGSRDKAPRKPGRWAHKTNETKAEEVKP